MHTARSAPRRSYSYRNLHPRWYAILYTDCGQFYCMLQNFYGKKLFFLSHIISFGAWKGLWQSYVFSYLKCISENWYQTKILKNETKLQNYPKYKHTFMRKRAANSLLFSFLIHIRMMEMVYMLWWHVPLWSSNEVEVWSH